ncbi:MAG: phage holin family protein [Truepera sp.]|jgi:putative membrane protein|nr:phage holin family protein [Truepera sp.]
MNLLLRWALSTVALWLTVRLGVGVSLAADDLFSFLLTALVIGLVNAVVRPVMVVLTLPLTVLSLGLFLLVVNGLALAIAAAITPLELSGFGGAVLGALVLSVLNTLLARVFAPRTGVGRP